jgi:site-specific DNA-adenine methylase
MKAPFVWFGGKRKVAPIVWQALGDVELYCEPFAGSLAMLLERPAPPRVEQVNDLDGYVANFWRACAHDPDQVAHYADWPVNENDLTARHIWLVQHKTDLPLRLEGDPDYYDAKIAGWWVWGINCWIGAGWCSGNGPWGSADGRLVHLGNPGQGVNRKLVHLGNPGRGVNRQRVSLAFPSRCPNAATVRLANEGLRDYMRALAERLRYVRVCCGDWKRIVTNGALSHGNTVGIFLDPPYSTDIRNDTLYSSDETQGDVAKEVFAWCMENANNPRYRIALCGYEGEHDMPADWGVYEWKANAAYQNAAASGANQVNRSKERIWFNRNCAIPDALLQTRLPL